MGNGEPKADNPAGRLYLLLTKMKSTPVPGQGAHIGLMLQRAFDLPDNDPVALFGQVVDINSTLSEVEQQLKQLDSEQYALFHETAQHLRGKIVNVSLGTQWAEYVGRIRPEDLLALKFASITLSRQLPERIIPDADLKDLSVEVQALYEFVENSDIDYALKATLLDGLLDLQLAIHDYKLRGTKGVEKAVSRLAGEAVLHPELRPDVDSKDESEGAQGESETNTPEWKHRFWKMMDHAAILLKIAQYLVPLLTSGSHPHHLGK